MIQSKKINIIVAVAVVFALITSIALMVIGNIHNENGGKIGRASCRERV